MERQPQRNEHGRQITIDYGKSLAEIIAAGRYDLVNDHISTERFSLTGTGVATCEARLFRFGPAVSSETAAEAIEKEGWQLGKIEHLLAFGAGYPEEQRKFTIIALGSSARVLGVRYVPYLGRRGSGRSTGLDWWDGGWDASYRFLGVHAVPSGV